MVAVGRVEAVQQDIAGLSDRQFRRQNLLEPPLAVCAASGHCVPPYEPPVGLWATTVIRQVSLPFIGIYDTPL